MNTADFAPFLDTLVSKSNLRLNKSNQLHFPGKKAFPASATLSEILAVMSVPDVDSLMASYGDAYQAYCRDAQGLYSALCDRLRPKFDSASAEVLGWPLKDLKFILSEGGRSSLLYNKAEDKTVSCEKGMLNYELARMFGELGKKEQPIKNDWLTSNSKVYRISYRPNCPRFFTCPKTGRDSFNTWTPAAYVALGDVSPILHQDFKDYFTRFFATAESMKYSLATLADMARDRAAHTTCLITEKGKTGKTLFYYIARALVGYHNATQLHESAGRNGFNAALRNHRVVFADEFALTKGLKNKLKALANGEIVVEEKGKDVEKSEDSFCSYILASNDFNDHHLLPKDRKFWCPDLNEEIIPDDLGARIVSHLQDDMLVAQLNAYLQWRFVPGISSKFPIATNTFYRLCAESREWRMSALMDALSENEVVTKRQLKLRDADTLAYLRKNIAAMEKRFGMEIAEFEVTSFSNWKIISKIYKGGGSNGEG